MKLLANISKHLRRGLGRLGLLLVLLGAANSLHAQAGDAVALAKLRAFSDYMAGLSSFGFVADAATDVVLTDGRKIKMTATGKGMVDRTAGFRMDRAGADGTTTVQYDGKTLGIANDAVNGYLALALPGGNDEALDGLRNQIGTDAVAGSDLIYAQPYDGLVLDMQHADYLGQAIVDGVLTDHLSVRAAEIDWQLWIKAKGDPIPVRYVVTSKLVAAAPEFSVTISDFTPNPPTIATDFAFVPPAGARLLTVGEVAELGLLGEE